MPRSVPVIVRGELEQPSSGDRLIWFATITHPHVNDPIRIVNDGADFVRDGVTWRKSGFQVNIVSDTDQPPRAEFAFPNVDREAVFKFRHVSGPPEVTLEWISSAYFDISVDPRVVKAGETVAAALTIAGVFLRGVTITAETCSGTLMRMDPSTEMWPNKIATEELLPGLYAR
jgi:hypothetical protein